MLCQKILISVLVSFLAFSACGKNKVAEESKKPATVENAVEESSLSTITLSSKAEERLGIEISSVEYKKLPGSLELGGEIISIPGSKASVSAPVSGVVLHPVSRKIPLAGKYVKKGEEILRLMTLPPESQLLGAQEEVAVRREELKVVQAKAERSKHLLSIEAISEKTYEEVQAELARSKALLNLAQAHLNLLNGSDLDSAAEILSTMVMVSPFEGVLKRIFVAPGQTVPASTALFELDSLKSVWIRVPVYIGDLDKIDLNKDAAVIPLGENQGEPLIHARPVQGPPTSNASSASADLYFEISNNERLFRIGQKTKISLLLKASEENRVIPWSAILYDINGGSWVYVKVSSHVYSRRRVEVSHIVDDLVVLTRGVNAGDEVVTAGAVELFGTEFGVGK